METPVEVDFQGMRARPDVRAAIEEHVAALEERCGRVTACRVVLKAPGGHHRTSGLYEVHIHLALPEGREVNVARTPPADERHADLTFAISDAFKHARRQLQDHVRRMQGQVKHHESQPIGTTRSIFTATACSTAHSTTWRWGRTSRSPKKWARTGPRQARSGCSESTACACELLSRNAGEQVRIGASHARC